MRPANGNAPTGQGRGAKAKKDGKSGRNGRRLGTRRQPDWRLFEALKRAYTVDAASVAEYDAGVRRAIRESGV